MEDWLDETVPWAPGRLRPPRRRAMVGIAIPLVAGTAAGIALPLPPLVFWTIGAVLLLPLLVWVRRPGSTAGLMLALSCLMAAHARQSLSPSPALSLAVLMPRPVEYIQFVAMAAEDAVPRPARPGQAPSAVVHARIEGINRDGGWRQADDAIRIVLRGEPSGRRLPRYGERWRMRGVVRPAVPRRSGLFSLPENQAVVDPDRLFFLEAGRGNPLKAACLGFRRKARAVLARGLEDYPDERGLLQALLLGYREDLPALLRQDFAVTGTVHIFAISGAHVGMVTMLLMVLLRTLRVPRSHWFWVVTPLLAGYTVATGAATSAVRACVMASLLLAAPLLRRKPDAVSVLAAAACAILVAAPGQLGDLGFLLSFTAVAGLIAVQPVFDAWAVKTFRGDAWQLPREELPEDRRMREAGLTLTRFGTVSVSAWIGTSPLTAVFFNLVSPVALGMNLLVIPTAFLILLSGVLSLLAAPLWSGGSEIFNHSARVWAQGLAGLIRWAASVPGGHWFVRAPPMAGVAVWYVVLTAAAVAARRVKGALPAGLLVLAALAVGWGVREGRRVRVAVLDAGEGNAVLVQAQSARWLVDAGPAYRADRTLRQLRAEGVNRLEALVLTHADAEHIGAAPHLWREIPVKELWLPVRTWPTPTLRAMLNEAESQGIAVRRLASGDSGDGPGNLFWEVLWPPPDVPMARADDASLVMRVARFGVSVLLTADAGEEQERAMIRAGESPAASVLLAGRHGDAGATSGPWLDAVRPGDVVVSGRGNPESGDRDRPLGARLEARGIREWRTEEDGMILVDLGGNPARWPSPGYRIRASRTP